MKCYCYNSKVDLSIVMYNHDILFILYSYSSIIGSVWYDIVMGTGYTNKTYKRVVGDIIKRAGRVVDKCLTIRWTKSLKVGFWGNLVQC